MYISISSKFFTNFRPKRRKRIEKQSRDPKNGMDHHGRCRMMFAVGFVFFFVRTTDDSLCNLSLYLQTEASEKGLSPLWRGKRDSNPRPTV